MKYGVIIAAGWPLRFGAKVGWDRLCSNRAEADALAARAERNDGWTAKVIELTDAEARRWLGWCD